MSSRGIFPHVCSLGLLHHLALGSDDVVLPARQPRGEVSSRLLTSCSYFQIVTDDGREQGRGQSSRSLAES